MEPVSMMGSLFGEIAALKRQLTAKEEELKYVTGLLDDLNCHNPCETRQQIKDHDAVVKYFMERRCNEN